MLIFGRAGAPSALRKLACIGAVVTLSTVTLSTITLTQAHAGWLAVGGCVGAPGAFNCVVRTGPAGDPYIREVPQPHDDAEKERAAARDRKWMDRCRPVIAQDHYGVPRYHYAAPGCEFGVID